MADWLGLVVVIGIFLVMAGFSCTIDIKKFFHYIKRPKGILIGLFCQYGCLPLAAFFISQILALSSLHSISFIITASCPGGTLSNFWCWFFGSDLELSIAMTASSSLLSFLFLTTNCLIYMPLITDTNVAIDYVSLGISVSSLILGVTFGLAIGYKTQNNKTQTHTQTQTQIQKQKNNKRKKKGNQCRQILIIIGAISMLMTLLLGAYQNTLVSATPAYKLPFEIFIAGLMLNGTSWFLTFILSYFICQLPNNQSITVCIECANQNVGLAIAIMLLTMDRYSADIAVGVPMFYGVLNAITIFIIGSILRLCGFIENLDDAFNHKFQNSGFTKLCLFINKHMHIDTMDTIDTIDTIDTVDTVVAVDVDVDVDDVAGGCEAASSSMIQLKSSSRTTLDDYDDEYDEEDDEEDDDDDEDDMLMEQTPSNEDVAIKQSFKNTNSSNIKNGFRIKTIKTNHSTYSSIKVNDTTPITEENERLQMIALPHDI